MKTLKKSSNFRSSWWVAGCVALALGLTAAPATASTSIYMPPERLAERATVVVEGRITRIASGIHTGQQRVFTYIDVEVSQVHRGPEDLEQLTLRESGGAVGDMFLEIDAAPHYEVGEQVFIFLEATQDGALRTLGMFYGKYSLEPSGAFSVETARRDLAGRGRILRRPEDDNSMEPVEMEEIDKRSLIALTAALSPARHRRGGRAGSNSVTQEWQPRPSEYDSLEWQQITELSLENSQGSSSTPVQTVYALDPDIHQPRFVALAPSNPTRWTQSDSGTPVVIDIDPTGNPLANDSQAVSEMVRAFDAWNNVPESRLQLSLGDGASNFQATHPQSPAVNFDGTNVILFDDPYDDISDPSGCAGVLAIGGYWRSGAIAGNVNGVDFHPAMQMYVIFNNNFQCYLSDPDNLAEVATHEIGHGIGFGHSTVFDAIMRSTAYGARGPRLGNDDQDAAHCHYPHGISLLTPDGGEQLTAGTTHAVQWSTSTESSGNPGTVNLELSTDGGLNWTTIADTTNNDGWYDWLVPDTPGTDLRVRVVRPARMGSNPSLYSEFCSDDSSNSSFEIMSAAPALPGAIASTTLRVDPDVGSDLRLSWSAGCSASIAGYAIYEGSLTDLRAGLWQPTAAVCDAGLDLEEVFTPAASSRFYLVVPHDASREGDLGSDSSGSLRAAPLTPCHAPTTGSSCS